MEWKWIPAVTVIFIAIILAGEVMTYSSGVYSYDSEASRNGDIVDYSISSSGTNDYSAVLMDNDGFKRLERLAVYVDEDYWGNISKAESISPVLNIDPVYYSEQIQRFLKLKSFDNVTICDSKGLIEYIGETSVDPKGMGIISMSYALPGEIYTGSVHDPLLKWIHDGGSLYWVGSIPGAFYYNNKELVSVENNQMLFFGSDNCINKTWELVPDSVGDDRTKALGLVDYQLYLGADVSKITCQCLAMGCMNGGVASTVLVECGEGMVVQFAGKFYLQQAEDISQVLASGICFKSTLVGWNEGRVTRTTVSGSFDSANGDVLYLFIGKTYSVYGRAYDV